MTNTHIAPLHPNCRCSFTALSAEEAGEDVDEEGPDAPAADGFGDAPDEIGQNTNSPFLVFTDYNAMAPGTDLGSRLCWHGGPQRLPPSHSPTRSPEWLGR